MDPFRGTVHHYESEAERAFLTVLISLPGVVRIREQRTVRYRLGGIDRTYTFDVVVDWACGTRVAYAVKATTNELRAGDTPAILTAVGAQLGTRFAHQYRAVTNDTLDPVALLNARLIVRCGRDHDYAAMDVVRDSLPRLGRSATLREVAEATGLGRRGVRAAVALIQSGVLANPGGARLDLDLPLESRSLGTALPTQ